MAKRRNEAVYKKRKEMAEKRRRMGDIIAYIVAGLALATVTALIIYSYTR